MTRDYFHIMKLNQQLNDPGNARSTQPEVSTGPSIQKVVDRTNVFMRHIAVIATSKVVQLTGSTWDAVVTSTNKGTFLIRRRKEYTIGECPCFGFEIRHIDAEGQQAGDSIPHNPAVVMALAQTKPARKPKVVPLPEVTHMPGIVKE